MTPPPTATAPTAHEPETFAPVHNVRFVTAAALFDGHDAAINIMRRLLQANGAEVIHLGHNVAAEDVVVAAIQEDAQAVAISSYQGGHMEFFKYVYDMLREKGAGHIKIYGGGGGVIVPREIRELQEYGINRIFSPEDGRTLGLHGMIRGIIREADFSTLEGVGAHDVDAVGPDDWMRIARLITLTEARAGLARGSVGVEEAERLLAPVFERAARREKTKGRVPVVGITGTGGAGKSSLTDELLLRFGADFPEKRVAVLSVDPSRKRTGGALLGDRIRMNSLTGKRVYMRSLATRQSGSELSAAINDAVAVCKGCGFDVVIVETSGIGQGSSAVVELCDVPVYVMTREYGAASQLEKIDMLDYARLVALNKFERQGSEDALRDVRKQMWRNRGAPREVAPDAMPVFPTIASRFNDPGVNAFYQALLREISAVSGEQLVTKRFTLVPQDGIPRKASVVPGARQRYLSEVAEAVRGHHSWAEQQADLASRMHAAWVMMGEFGGVRPLRLAHGHCGPDASAELLAVTKRYNELRVELAPECREMLAGWPDVADAYTAQENVYTVRGKEIRVANYRESLSHLQIPKVSLPEYSGWGDVLLWMLRENVPGSYPYTAGVFPYKRQGEDPTRMFAGEGPPAQTNERFKLLANGQPAARLSTAFDSVTLYGEDPHERPDIYGKVGESGVSVCTVEDAEILYSGFDLCAPNTSVSMTINGPAPIVLAFFMNTAIRQQARKFLMEQGRIAAQRGGATAWNDPRNFDATWETLRAKLSDSEFAKIEAATLAAVRGTVQADILKEDQAQNTCIFSTEFSLKLMGDVQQYFIDRDVKNFYSVSISGYHIAEAGANPVSQLAFTLANGFTYVETYLARGMKIDDFAPNLSFFFSNGLDPEYSVIGRVARRIWAVAMKRLYGAAPRSQMLKYHIQTSGRSLHAMEIDFNDIRTTLQALMAVYDNCNSLHTNAYDEAITTPTEESVRRALAIQLIINRELGLAMNENPMQGSFIIEELTRLVEEAVLEEFDRLTSRGGVLGAMETQYQRGNIQEESMYYEQLKHTGELPIVGVNTFLNPNAESGVGDKIELRRASPESKRSQIAALRAFQQRHASTATEALRRLQDVALANGNVFGELMSTVRHCSLGQISGALYEVGGRYRRNM